MGRCTSTALPLLRNSNGVVHSGKARAVTSFQGDRVRAGVGVRFCGGFACAGGAITK